MAVRGDGETRIDRATNSLANIVREDGQIILENQGVIVDVGRRHRSAAPLSPNLLVRQPGP
ncbi:MAG: hypothetical protein AAB368_05445, partial [bacterium]